MPFSGQLKIITVEYDRSYERWIDMLSRSLSAMVWLEVEVLVGDANFSSALIGQFVFG